MIGTAIYIQIRKKRTVGQHKFPSSECQVRGAEIQRLLFIGVGCQVQALRSVEDDLGLEELYVLGTNCVDNPRDAEATSISERCELGSCRDHRMKTCMSKL